MIVIVMILAVFAALLYAEYLKAKADYEYAQIRRKLEMCKDAQTVCSGDCEHCAWGID